MNNASQSNHGRIGWLPGDAHQQGALSVCLSAALWGLFWIPLRFLNDHGVPGLWSVTLVMGALIVPALFVLVLNKKVHSLKSGDTWFIGCALGLSTVFYFCGISISDVIRVVFLFYLLPVWTTLAARILYKEPITPLRMLVIVFALLGMWLLLGGGSLSVPIPSNVGDWCGLLAGMCWGVSLALVRGKEEVDAVGMACTTAIGATVIALIAALLLRNTELAMMPEVDSVTLIITASLGFSVLLLFPALMGQLWGAKRVAAPTAALLTMSEILMATASAYLLIGTDLNTASMVGAAIILVAVLTDIAMQRRELRKNRG